MSQRTIRLTEHARRRCAEMRIHTRTVKEVWATRTSTFPDGQKHANRVFVTAACCPGIALTVEDPESDDPVVVTVLWYDCTEPVTRESVCPEWCGLAPDIPHWHDEAARFTR